MNSYILQMLLCGLIIVTVNMLYIAYLTEKHDKKEQMLYCENGDYKGQLHTMTDWRRIAIELAKSVKNSRLNAMVKHGTDEDVIGILYLEFGVELCDF